MHFDCPPMCLEKKVSKRNKNNNVKTSFIKNHQYSFLFTTFGPQLPIPSHYLKKNSPHTTHDPLIIPNTRQAFSIKVI